MWGQILKKAWIVLVLVIIAVVLIAGAVGEIGVAWKVYTGQVERSRLPLWMCLFFFPTMGLAFFYLRFKERLGW